MKCNIWRVAVRPSYKWDARFLKVNVIIAVLGCPLPSAFPEPFVALYILYVTPYFSYGLTWISCVRHFSKTISSRYCPNKMLI